MRRLSRMTLLVATTLVAASPAHAAVPSAGVAIVNAQTRCFSGGCVWEANFDRRLGVGAGQITAEWSADASHWTIVAPQTLMVVEPTLPERQLCTANVFGRAVCTMSNAQYAYVGCSVNVHGGLGADVIRIRNLVTTPNSCGTEYPGFHEDVLADRGNDTIYVQDGLHTNVDCGPGFDLVFADVGDTAPSDCERVFRG